MALVKPYNEDTKREHFEDGSWGHPFALETLISSETGKRISDVDWLSERMRNKTLKDQTEKLVGQLSEGGIHAKVKDNVIFYGLVSGKKIQKESYRNINILPLVAQKNRANQKRELAYFLEGRKYARYLVVTNGQRIEPLGDFSGQMAKFSRRISKWVHEAKKRYKVKTYMRTFEFPRNKEGYHLHANIIYEPSVKLSRKKWSEFLAWTNAYFDTVLEDAGRIQNLNEIIKYVLKPETLNGASVDEICWLVNETFGKRIFSAFGEFAEFRKDLKNSGMKLTTKDGRQCLMLKENFRSQNDEEEDELLTKDVTNQLLTILAPTPLCSPFKEPVAVIRNFKSHGLNNQVLDSYVDLMHPNEPTKFTKLRDLAQEAWQRNGGADIPTVLAYAKTLEDTADVNKVEFLSSKKAQVQNTALANALDREYKDMIDDETEDAEASSFSVHKRAITVLAEDKELAERQLIYDERRRIADKELSKIPELTAKIIDFPSGS